MTRRQALRATAAASSALVLPGLADAAPAAPAPLAVSSGQHALLTPWVGGSLSGLPGPVDLDAAGAILDTYLKASTS